ncbi:MAG: endonuclease III domain-containing protein [bacterium]
MNVKIINKIISILIEHYKNYSRDNLPCPVDELIRTVLSQNTTDLSSNRVFNLLKARFPTWEMVLEDGIESELKDIIRPAGLGPTKAERIIGILNQIKKREGVISLDRLRDMTDDTAISYLTDIKGIGAKTAYCVMAFSFGRDLSPVDTHVHRVATRIGILPEKVNIDKAHRLLNEVLPVGKRLMSHFALINHGRKVCRAKKPICVICPIIKHCNYCKYIEKNII